MKRANPPPAELESLVVAAGQGDEKAFARLILLTQDRLFRFCVYLCNNRELAQDIVQETYLRGFRGLKSLTKPSAFLDWSFRIARNVFLDIVRSEPTLEELKPEAIENVSAGGDVSLVLAVQQVLSQFETDDRLRLILIEIEQQSYAEAAEILRVSEDTVRSRLHRLRKEFLEKWRSQETK